MCTQKELDKILQKIVAKSRLAYGEELNGVILFGSYARGDNGKFADIDIMLLLNCEDAYAYKYRAIASDISSEVGLDTDEVISFSIAGRDDFEKKKSWYPFYRNVSQEGRFLYG